MSRASSRSKKLQRLLVIYLYHERHLWEEKRWPDISFNGLNGFDQELRAELSLIKSRYRMHLVGLPCYLKTFARVLVEIFWMIFSCQISFDWWLHAKNYVKNFGKDKISSFSTSFAVQFQLPHFSDRRTTGELKREKTDVKAHPFQMVLLTALKWWMQKRKREKEKKGKEKNREREQARRKITSNYYLIERLKKK